MLRQLSGMMLLGLLTVVGAGCCGVQGMQPGGMYGSSCDGGCPPGPMMGLASCGSACGEVYVDEWISERPIADNCGSNCGGCTTCRRPVRNVLRLLWGRPYMSQCDTGLCSSGGADCGCDSMGGDGFIDEGYAQGGYAQGGYADGGFQSSGYAGSGPKKPCNCGASHGNVEYGQDWSGSGQILDSGRSPGMPPAMPPTNNSPRLAPELMPAPSPEASPGASSKPSVAPSSATRRLNPAVARRR